MHLCYVTECDKFPKRIKKTAVGKWICIQSIVVTLTFDVAKMEVALKLSCWVLIAYLYDFNNASICYDTATKASDCQDVVFLFWIIDAFRRWCWYVISMFLLIFGSFVLMADFFHGNSYIIKFLEFSYDTSDKDLCIHCVDIVIATMFKLIILAITKTNCRIWLKLAFWHWNISHVFQEIVYQSHVKGAF